MPPNTGLIRLHNSRDPTSADIFCLKYFDLAALIALLSLCLTLRNCCPCVNGYLFIIQPLLFVLFLYLILYFLSYVWLGKSCLLTSISLIGHA